MSDIVALECLCGKVKGTVEVIPQSFFHVHCLCSDCQKFASYLRNEKNILDAHGGSELFQTYPDSMKITEGTENIACVQLKHKGLYRWHTRCCNMPLANTMRSSSIPFIGVSVKLMKFTHEYEKNRILGPVILKAFGKDAIGDMPKDAHPKFPISYMPKILGFMLKGILKEKSSPSPFFSGKEPVATVNLSSE